MNLKQTLSKTVASIISVYMVFGNFAMAGIGLSQVIAEEIKAPEVVLTAGVEKYVQYEKEGSKGTVLQEKIAIAQKSDQSTYLPVKDASISVEVPKINGVLPTRASVITSNLAATKATNISQNYNAESGLLDIAYDNGNNSANYRENAKDEIEIAYVYPEASYIADEGQCNISHKVSTKLTYQAEKETLSAGKTENFQFTQTKNVGDISNLDIVGSSQVFKGFLYSNVNNKSNHATDYTVKTKLTVLNSEMVNQIKINLANSKFIYTNDEKEQKEANTDTIRYVSSKIGEDEFYKVFGLEGYIDFYVGAEKYATVRYSDADKKGNRDFTTEYVGDRPAGAEAGKVIYPANTTEVNIVTGNPVAEAVAYIETQKQITASTNYGAKVNSLKTIFENYTLEAIKNKTEEKEVIDANGEKKTEQVTTAVSIQKTETKGNVALQEPSTQMSIDASNKSLSTLSTNKTTLTVRLNDTNSSCTLFKAGTMEIKLPNNLTNVKIAGAKILYANGLSVKGATIKDGKIILTIEGEQKAYDVSNINGGVNIVIDLEDITFDARTPSHAENITLSYAGKTTNVGVNIVSKAGVLLLNKVSTSEGANSTSVDPAEKTVALAMNKQGQTLTQNVYLVNNYAEELSGVSLVGTIGDKDDRTKGNIENRIAEAITVSGAEADVYYSADGSNWSKTFTKDANAYRVALKGNLAAAGSVAVAVKVNVPDGLTYNQKSYFNTVATYTNEKNALSQGSLVNLVTEEKDIIAPRNANLSITKKATTVNSNGQTVPVTVAITPHVTQEVVHAGQIVTYTINVKNNSNEDLSNITVEDSIPNNAVYTYYNEDSYGDTGEDAILKDNTIKSKTWSISSLKANATATMEIMLTMGEVNTEQEIKNIINVTYNGETVSEENRLMLKPAAIIADLQTNETMYNLNDVVYKENDIAEYYVTVKNISNSTLNNIRVEQTVPQHLTYQNGGLGEYRGGEVPEVIEQGKLENNEKFNYTIRELSPQEEKIIVITYKVKNLGQSLSDTEESIANIYIGDELYQTNTQTLKIKGQKNTITMESNIEGDRILKAEDKVIYTINVKNNGESAEQIEVQDRIPEQIEVEKVAYEIDGEEVDSFETGGQVVSIAAVLNAQSTLKVSIKGKVTDIKTAEKQVLTVNNTADLIIGEAKLTSNAVSLNIETIEDGAAGDYPGSEDVSGGNESVGDNTVADGNSTTGGSTDEPGIEGETHSISGVAWLDDNRDGKRDEGEDLLSGMTVTLINSATGETVKNSEGNAITTTTDESGAYTFSNVANGTYLVMFDFDTNEYTVTTYQKNGVNATQNSDAIMSNVNVDGNSKRAGVTNNIQVNGADITNIDIGLIKNAVFDLSLDKMISSITVVNSKGTKTKEYRNKNFAKVDLVAKYMNNTNVIVTYKFVITNKGEVTGYVDRLVDNLPSGLEFNSELNKDWYRGSNGNLYTSLDGIAIKPGESKEVELVLTKKTTENSTGTFSNNAELASITNIEAIEEKDAAKENNKSSADVVISIKTGSAMLYTGITLAGVAIIGAGVYLVKKKATDSEEI